jgi:hypothetical protein
MKRLGMDGLFKELTWTGKAISQIFDLPPIVGEPIQQEFQQPLQRRLDRLYRLLDGSLLNVEHQSSVGGAEALARRLAHYHLLVTEKFPDVPLHQVVIFAPVDRSKAVRVPSSIRLELTDPSGHGLRFSAPIRDLRNVPFDVFERSGEMDDLLLGLLGPGWDMPDYVEKVRARVGQLTGEARTATLEKLAAIWLMNDNLRNKGYREVFDMSWIDEVKDRPSVQQFVEIAGKERIARERTEGARRALAGVLVNHARKAGLDLYVEPDHLIEQFAIYADETQLQQMIEDMPQMTDVREFVRAHNIELPGFTV